MTEAEILPPPAKPKRPAEFSDAIFDEICDRMANGEGLRKICEDPEMPSRQTFLRWIEKDTGRQNKYQAAREALMDWYGEEILTIAWDSSKDTIRADGKKPARCDNEWVNRSRLKVDTLKFLMAKLHPKRYGDKVEIEGAVDNKTEITVIRWSVAPIHDDNGGIIPSNDTERLIARIKQLEDRLAGKEADQPPKLLTYDPGPLPTRIEGEIVLKLVDVIKQNVPRADQRPPEEVLDEVLAECAKALKAKYGTANAAA